MSKLIEIEVSGEDPELWKKLRSKLLKSIDQFLDIVINPKNDNTIREETKEYLSSILEYGKAKLNEPVVQNAKTEMQIKKLYYELETERALARKTNAEAQSIEFDNALKSLKLSLLGIKAMLSGEQNEEVIAFCKKVDTYLQFLEEVNKSDL